MNTDPGPPPSSGSKTATGPHGRYSVQDVLVVGSGAMGAQIAMACALAGYRVTVQDISAQSLTRAETSLREILQRRVQKGRLSAEARDAASARLVFTTELTGAAASADFVMEAAIEDLAVKKDLFYRLDELCPPRTILADRGLPAGAEMIAEISVDADAARLLTWHAADLAQRGEPFAAAASKAKLFASEAAVKASNLAIQVFGGYGYVDEYPVQNHAGRPRDDAV